MQDADGNTYNTVKIGSQCWRKENLNVGTRIDGSINQSNTSTIEKYCYENLESNCDTYGGLYQWNEAMEYVSSPGAQGICPTDWHIPTYAEFQELSVAVSDSSNSLKAVGQGTGSGTGTNTSGFSGLLLGNHSESDTWSFPGYESYFWSSSFSFDIYYTSLTLNRDNNTIALNGNSFEVGNSIRCIRNK